MKKTWNTSPYAGLAMTLFRTFFAKDINSNINLFDTSLINMFTTKTTKQQLCMFHAICFKVSTHFFLQVVATHPSHHHNLQQQPCCITSNVAQACTSNTICGWVCEQVCHPSTYGPGNWPTQPLSHQHRLFEKQCWSSRTGLHHDKNSGTLELCSTSSHFCLGFWLQVQNNASRNYQLLL